MKVIALLLLNACVGLPLHAETFNLGVSATASGANVQVQAAPIYGRSSDGAYRQIATNTSGEVLTAGGTGSVIGSIVDAQGTTANVITAQGNSETAGSLAITLVNAVSSKSIRVLNFMVNTSATASVYLTTSPTGTQIGPKAYGGAMTFDSNGASYLGQTASGEKLSLNVPSGYNVSWWLLYYVK